MGDALEGYEGGVKCAGGLLTDLRFADIDLLDETKDGLRETMKRLETASKRYGMEISMEKSKVLVVGKEHKVHGVVVKLTVVNVEGG